MNGFYLLSNDDDIGTKIDSANKSESHPIPLPAGIKLYRSLKMWFIKRNYGFFSKQNRMQLNYILAPV